MSTATIKRFLMLLSSTKNLEQAQLYQLLQKAESCYCLKDKRGQYEFGKALALFSPPFNLIGDYYQATYLNKMGQKQIARENLERVREEVGGIYGEKAILTLSGFKERDGELDESFKLRLELAKSESLPVVIESAIGVAAILSSQGEHQKARKHLEAVLPYLSKLGPVPLYFDTLNSYALVLAEVGETDLATEVITPVVLSPYTSSYLNWIESAKEIREKSSRRSMITMNRSNVIDFPTKEKEEPEEIEEPYTYPYSEYIDGEFRVQDKVEDWIYGATEPDDLGVLMIALSETKDDLERDMIIGKVIDSTFVHSDEAKKAKDKWKDRLISRIK